jgi:hypothetical protein
MLAMAANARRTLLAGFTTVQGWATPRREVRDAIALPLAGPRMLTSLGPLSGSPGSDSLRQLVRDRKAAGADVSDLRLAQHPRRRSADALG